MYVPSHFAEPRVDELHRLIRENPLGALVTHGPAGLDANHLPFELDPERNVLLAHIARANPIANGDALVIFRGVQGYVSPSWYPSKHETHQQVPTWNYEVVHVHGTLRRVDDAKFLRGVLAKLTKTHEATQAAPWKMSDAPPEFIAELLTELVGVEIEITRLEGKRKLSQNREPRDAQGVVDALKERGQHAHADAITGTRFSR
jgi:transcriptional regulator